MSSSCLVSGCLHIQHSEGERLGSGADRTCACHGPFWIIGPHNRVDPRRVTRQPPIVTDGAPPLVLFVLRAARPCSLVTTPPNSRLSKSMTSRDVIRAQTNHQLLSQLILVKE